jgi:pimeloyl-ACP methyl ester carboxylesterase
MEQRIRFCRTEDGVRIAYASLGAGAPIVQALGWLTHLERGWNVLPRPWSYRLAEKHRLVIYDGRGVGLSDRDVNDFSLAAKVNDLAAVIDAAGLKRTSIVGVSEGAATAVAYTVRHPERVSRLVLFEGSTRPPADQPPDLLEAMATVIEAGWGQESASFRRFFTDLFYPDADDIFAAWFTELQRASATPLTAARYWRAACTIDVTSLLPRISTPTLVVHRAGMPQALAPEEGRALAAAIPGARFLSLPGRNHVPLPNEPEYEDLPRAIEAFVDEDAAPAGLSRREVEVLRLLAAGKHNEEIARALVISPRTVGYHVTNILNKLGAANRAEAAAFAAREGLMDNAGHDAPR